MIRQDHNRTQRWQAGFVFTLLLLALLFFIQPQNLAIVLAMIVGYVIALLAFDAYLKNLPDNDF